MHFRFIKHAQWKQLIQSRQKKSGQFFSDEKLESVIRHLIANEDPQKPLTDKQIQKILGNKGFHISFRFVEKIRKLHHLPAPRKRMK